MTKPVLVAWSGGKDSALALARMQADPKWEVVGLLTTFVERYDRVQMHGVRRVLVQGQADALGLPLHTVWLPPQANNRVYERALRDALSPLRAAGVEAVAFGDLFLEDIRAYRENLLVPTRMQAHFPLWGADTRTLAQQAVAEGWHATIVCVDPTRLDPDFLGRPFDADLLLELPPGVDPCGERGEFHTFVHDGPGFRYRLQTVTGARREWMGHHTLDLLPVAQPVHEDSGSQADPGI